MNMKKRFALLPALFAVAALWPAALPGAASSNEAASKASFERLDRYIVQQMRRLRIPGLAVAVVEKDRIVHMRGFGRAEEGGPPPSPQTSFILGSVTKSFTSLAIMQLVEAGKVGLDDPVRRYLPWFGVADAEAGGRMTVRHLLNQTSGLPQSAGLRPMTDYDGRLDACERQARGVAALKTTRPAGSAFEYSNMNYNLLGLIVQAASGEPYEEYIERHIFSPLAMGHSYTSRRAAKENGMASGNRYWFGFPVAAPDMPFPRASLPSGFLISSPEDMAHYLMAQLNGGRYGAARILSPPGIDELHRPAVRAEINGISMGQYAMGWFVRENGPTRIVWHSGLVPDFFSYAALLPEKNRGIVVLANVDHEMMNLALAEVAMGTTTWLATGHFAPIRLGFLPWVFRGLLLIPLLQIASAGAGLRIFRLWRQGRKSRPTRWRKWARILLPLAVNLLVAFVLLGVLLGQGTLALRLLSMPDFAWTALVCGSFSLVWGVVRTVLAVRALKAPSPRRG